MTVRRACSRLASLLAMMCACHAPSPRPSAESHRHGSVVGPAGVLAGGGILVTITGLTSSQVSRVKTGATGQFDFELPPGRYAFAAVSPTGFAFVEQDV